MNRLKYLRESLNLSLRQLRNYANVSNSLLSLLESEKRMWRLSHIDTLTSFFKVSSDFLLGKSDNGIFVEVKSGFVSLSLEKYEELKRENKIKEYIAYGSVWRIPEDELEEEKIDPTIRNAVRVEIEKELDTLTKKQLEKVLNFIKEFIKK